MANKYIIEAATYNGDGTTSSEAVGSTVTISNASPGVVTWNSHPFVANDVVYFKTSGALPTGLTAGTKYFVRNPAANTFEVSLTSGGASINTSSAGSGTHTAAGVGAWNDVGFMFSGVVNGSIAAGDVVYIRSKTGNGANANIAKSHTGSNFGSSAATTTAHVRWVLDNGTIWSGIDGTLTFTGSSVSHQVIPRNFNDFVSATPWNWSLRNTAGGNYLFPMLGSTEVTCYGIFFDLSASSGGYTALSGASQSSAYLENCKVKGAPFATATRIFEMGGGGMVLTCVNLTIELTHPCSRVFGPLLAGTMVKVVGGSMFGTGCTSATVLRDTAANGESGTADYVGFQYPQAVLAHNGISSAWPVGLKITGCDNGAGSIIVERWGIASSRTDGYFPYLNAALPNSGSTGWSWYLYSDQALQAQPWMLNTGKYFTNTAAALTITQELLEATGWGSAVDTSTLWMVVSYVDDTTGAMKHVSTRSHIPGTALTTSTAGWSATTYGAVSFNKRKLSLTTPTTVKKDTAVWVTVMGTNVSGGATTKYFVVCPDVQIS